jgi:hypothetical protein
MQRQEESVMARGIRPLALAAGALAILVAPTLGHARGKTRPLIGAKKLAVVKPQVGFVDNPIAFDGAGGRLAYINTDAGKLAELRVLDLAQRARQLFSVDISKFTTTPVSVRFVLDGEHFFIISRAVKNKPATAALIDRKGKIKRKFGPASEIRLTRRNGKPIVVAYTLGSKRKGGRTYTVHTVVAKHLATGRKAGRKRVLVADNSGMVKKLDFRIVYWADNFTRAVGIKGGTWDRRDNQRSPDVEAWYDVISGVFSKKIPIDNPMAHTVKMRRLAKHDNEPRFVALKRDRTAVVVYGPKGKERKVKLASPFGHYKPNTLHYRHANGGLFFSLVIDPLNPDALARKRSVPRYLDLYFLPSGSNKAVRKARMLMRGKRQVRWWATQLNWVVVPKHIGFDRGGTKLKIFTLK